MRAKTVLITGSSAGIGLAMAKLFAREGYNIALNSFEDSKEVSAIIDDVKSLASGRVDYLPFDLSQAENGFHLANKVIKEFGRLDILINNAGVQKVAPIDELDPKDWERVRTISLDASYHTIRAALPFMKKQQWGRIINISSAHGLVASPYKSAYIAAKHALIGLTKTVALEVAEQNITVNAICPGYVLTPLVEKQLDDQAKVHKISKEEVASKIMLANQPTKKFIEPREIASLALYLCSDMARSITGTAISIDGGWTAR